MDRSAGRVTAPSDVVSWLSRFQPTGAVEAAACSRVIAAMTAGDCLARSAALHVTGSALVVHPPTNRILLRWHPKLRRWMQIGGHADAGETDPLVVTHREGREETGLRDLTTLERDGCALVQVAIVPVPATQEEPAHEHADLRFVLATATPDSTLAETGAPLRWFTPDDAVTEVAESNLVELVEPAAALL